MAAWWNSVCVDVSEYFGFWPIMQCFAEAGAPQPNWAGFEADAWDHIGGFGRYTPTLSVLMRKALHLHLRHYQYSGFVRHVQGIDEALKDDLFPAVRTRLRFVREYLRLVAALIGRPEDDAAAARD